MVYNIGGLLLVGIGYAAIASENLASIHAYNT
jgi:hypothetical protein